MWAGHRKEDIFQGTGSVAFVGGICGIPGGEDSERKENGGIGLIITYKQG